MPTYDYRCERCEAQFEFWQSFSEDSLTACPTTGGPIECVAAGEGPVKKVFSRVGIAFKGEGFYKNDHGANAKDRTNGDKAKDSSTSSEAKPDKTSSEPSSASSSSSTKSSGSGSPGSGSSGSGSSGSSSSGSGSSGSGSKATAGSSPD